MSQSPTGLSSLIKSIRRNGGSTLTLSQHLDSTFLIIVLVSFAFLSFIANFTVQTFHLIENQWILDWTTAILASIAFVVVLIIDQHIGWIPALLLIGTSSMLGFMTFNQLPEYIEFTILGFIANVLIFLNINRLFGTFEYIRTIILKYANSLMKFLIITALLGGTTAFLFDEGSSVGMMAIIQGSIVAGIILTIAVNMDEHTEGPLVEKVRNLMGQNFVFGTNLLAFFLAIGHPVSLAIATWAGWDLIFWIKYMTPISVVCFVVGMSIFWFNNRHTIAELETHYRDYRNIQLAYDTNATSKQKWGLSWLIIMGILQVLHQELAHLLQLPHAYLLICMPMLLTIPQVLQLIRSNREQLFHIPEQIPIGEFINMFGIFYMAGILTLLGILTAISHYAETLIFQFNNIQIGGIWVLGSTAAFLSALLENLGVGVTINNGVDIIFGGIANTTGPRMAVGLGAMLAGNFLQFASVAGLIGIPLYLVAINQKLRQVKDTQEQLISQSVTEYLQHADEENAPPLLLHQGILLPNHNFHGPQTLEKMIRLIEEGISAWHWFKQSAVLTLVTVIIALVMVSGYTYFNLLPQGIWYCHLNDTTGCIERESDEHSQLSTTQLASNHE